VVILLGLVAATLAGLSGSFLLASLSGKGRAAMLVTALTAVTGYADSRGFVHAAHVWSQGQVVWREVALSGLGFLVGVVAYWAVVRFAGELGVHSAFLQTLGWFAVTIAAVAVAEGGAFRWQPVDIVTAGVVVSGLGLLLYRTA